MPTQAYIHKLVAEVFCFSRIQGYKIPNQVLPGSESRANLSPDYEVDRGYLWREQLKIMAEMKQPSANISLFIYCLTVIFPSQTATIQASVLIVNKCNLIFGVNNQTKGFSKNEVNIGFGHLLTAKEDNKQVINEILIALIGY